MKSYMEVNSRSVLDVIDKILPLIPDKEYVLKRELRKYSDDQFNKAPEVLRGSYCWGQFVNILNSHITKFDEEWKIQMRTIINN